MQDDKLEKLWQDIKTQRDGLRVQMHLAGSKLEKLADEVEDSAEELRESIGVIGSEIKDTYHLIRTRLMQEQG